MPPEKEPYQLVFRNDTAKKSYEALYGQVNDVEKRRFDAALEQLRHNPYPANPEVTAGTIRRLEGVDGWRYKVSYSYRITYIIRVHQVIITAVDHRKDIYRKF